jgi:DMSO/TMAO reductase YedYZ molybdopterin-dependent catalytic subunit
MDLTMARLLMKGVYLLFLFCLMAFCNTETCIASDNFISVHGAIEKPLKFSMDDLKKMPSTLTQKVVVIKEKVHQNDNDKLNYIANYQGVLLRHILEQAGITFVGKYEPAVFIIVKGSTTSTVFSLGEIFYSIAGKSILVAYEKNGEETHFPDGCGELIVPTDIRSGRMISGIREIVVERANIKMVAYSDTTKNIMRPPSSKLSLVDNNDKKTLEFSLTDLKELPSEHLPAIVMIGDCGGFNGIFSFEGVSLRSLLKKADFKEIGPPYNHYIVVSSEDGFCATFSTGEIFNSRLMDDAIIAYLQDGQPLGPHDGFTMSVVREDCYCSRSVKRINKVELF